MIAVLSISDSFRGWLGCQLICRTGVIGLSEPVSPIFPSTGAAGVTGAPTGASLVATVIGVPVGSSLAETSACFAAWDTVTFSGALVGTGLAGVRIASLAVASHAQVPP